MGTWPGWSITALIFAMVGVPLVASILLATNAFGGGVSEVGCQSLEDKGTERWFIQVHVRDTDTRFIAARVDGDPSRPVTSSVVFHRGEVSGSFGSRGFSLRLVGDLEAMLEGDSDGSGSYSATLRMRSMDGRPLLEEMKCFAGKVKIPFDGR
jgi:hypothetical protein